MTQSLPRGRIALLVPIVLALADELGLAEGSAGRIGAVLAVGVGVRVRITGAQAPSPATRNTKRQLRSTRTS